MTRRARRGMTLMETLVAIAIVLVISMVGWQSVQGSIELGQVLANDDETTRAARVALGRLRRDIQLAFLQERKGQVDTFRTEFVGEDRDPDTLWFTTFSHQRLYRDARESDQAEVTVWVDDVPREHGPGDVLLLRESSRIDQYMDEGGRVLPLAYHVETFDLHYLDGRTNEWRSEWDTRSADTPNMLPRAVRIGLVLLAPDPDDPDRTVERAFLTTVLLDFADPVQPLQGPVPE